MSGTSVNPQRPHPRSVATTTSDLAEGEAAQRVGEVVAYNEFARHAAHLRELLTAAQRREHEQFDVVSQQQQRVLKATLDPRHDPDALTALEDALREAEAEWKARALYCAELRAEVDELIRERDGDTAERDMRFSGPHTLDKAKPVVITATDVSSQRRVLVREAYPAVSPRVARSVALPSCSLDDAALRQQFAALDHEQSGSLPLERVEAHFRAQDALGVLPESCENFVREALHGARALTSGRVSFDEFALLQLRWARL